MRIAGIIAEYDPFHRGHQVHIDATRSAHGGGASHVVAVISGSFTQRGEPAQLTKFARARMALACGADLVLELPLPWAMASAERFAAGGVAVLAALGCVDTLSFGSECGDIDTLRQLAALPDEPAYRKELRRCMDTGIPYAAARQTAAAALIDDQQAAALASPNNTLGMEYIRAATLQNAKFAFFTLQRRGALHTDNVAKDGYASATLLRQWLREGNTAAAQTYMPPAAYAVLEEAMRSGTAPAEPGRLDRALLARLRSMSQQEFAVLPYLSEGLENRLYRAAQTATTVKELLNTVKTRRYPMARIRRILWAALLGLSDSDEYHQLPYIRVLGMNARGQEILAAARPTLPLLTRYSQLTDMSEQAQTLFALECRATDLHALTLPVPPPCGTDRTTKLLRSEP